MGCAAGWERQAYYGRFLRESQRGRAKAESRKRKAEKTEACRQPPARKHKMKRSRPRLTRPALVRLSAFGFPLFGLCAQLFFFSPGGPYTTPVTLTFRL